VLEGERREGRRRLKATGEIESRLAAKRARLPRLQNECEKALAVGDTRRAAELAHRTQRIQAEIEREQHELDQGRRDRERDHTPSRGDRVGTPEEVSGRAAFLDQQASLPAARSRSGPRRDYPQLAYLAGLGREHYMRLGPREQRIARLEIDRELALRRVGTPAGTRLAKAGSPPPGGHSRASAGSGIDRAVGGAPRDGRATRTSAEANPAESSVMRDAREVAARRKRQLGTNRP
jgi:hypothetical protein